MGEADAREVERRKLYDEQKAFVQKVKETLEEHLEGRRRFIKYSPYNLRGESWIWGLGSDIEAPRRGFPWVYTVFTYPDGKIYLDLGSCDIDMVISEDHPKIFMRLLKSERHPGEGATELFKIVEELQSRDNWKKYQRMIPKVIDYFMECDSIAKDVSRDHGVRVEFVVRDHRCGIHAVVDTENMSDDEKLKAIIEAAEALKDFDDRLSETQGDSAGAH